VSDGPRILATDGKTFRIVRVEMGERITNVLEKADGCDALGVERWREVNVGQAETVSRWLRDWIIQHALACEQLKEQ
jgi:hypothetical protein